MSCTRRALLALTVTRNRLFFWKRGIGRNLFRRRRPEASRMLEIDDQVQRYRIILILSSPFRYSTQFRPIVTLTSPPSFVGLRHYR